jgi:hypothetical protein
VRRLAVILPVSDLTGPSDEGYAKSEARLLSALDEAIAADDPEAGTF